MSDSRIVHETGYKDDYKVTVYLDNDQWSPTNKELFKLIKLWFESEEHEFGDGYGSKMPWFYISQIMLGKSDKAFEAYEKRGFEAVEHFENQVAEDADELITEIEKLKEASR